MVLQKENRGIAGLKNSGKPTDKDLPEIPTPSKDEAVIQQPEQAAPGSSTNGHLARSMGGNVLDKKQQTLRKTIEQLPRHEEKKTSGRDSPMKPLMVKTATGLEEHLEGARDYGLDRKMPFPAPLDSAPAIQMMSKQSTLPAVNVLPLSHEDFLLGSSLTRSLTDKSYDQSHDRFQDTGRPNTGHGEDRLHGQVVGEKPKEVDRCLNDQDPIRDEMQDEDVDWQEQCQMLMEELSAQIERNRKLEWSWKRAANEVSKLKEQRGAGYKMDDGGFTQLWNQIRYNSRHWAFTYCSGSKTGRLHSKMLTVLKTLTPEYRQYMKSPRLRPYLAQSYILREILVNILESNSKDGPLWAGQLGRSFETLQRALQPGELKKPNLVSQNLTRRRSFPIPPKSER
jgi:hypothetical protein